MKRLLTCLILASSVVASQAATIIPVSQITGHHKGDGDPPPTDNNGAIVRIINGNGTTQPDPTDPATWTHATGWTSGWQGQQIGTLTLNQGWIVLDMGANTEPLGSLFLWNVNEGTGSVDRGIDTFQLFIADTPTVTPPVAGGTAVDYDFSSGGWTALGGVRSLPIGLGNAPLPVSAIIDLGGINNRYIGIEVIANHGSTARTGLAELAVTQAGVMFSPSDTIWEGESVTLSVNGSGSNPTYQWKKGGVDVSGATGATLTFDPAAATDSGPYSVAVSNDAGSFETDAATLTVKAVEAPSFTADPQSVERYLTGSATFSVVVDGTPPIALQWALDSVDIPGATGDTLTVTNITAGDAGNYTVTASNAQGSNTSAPGTLSIRTPAANSYEEGVAESGPIGYWRMDETSGFVAVDYMSGYDAAHNASVYAGDPGPQPGDFDGMEADNKAAYYNGVDAGSTTGESLMSDLGQFTMMAFINPGDLDSDLRIGFIGQNDVSEFGIHGGTDFAIWTPGSGTVGTNKTALPQHEWSHIACVGDGEAVHFYLDGALLVSGSHTPTTNYGSSDFAFNMAYAILDGSGNFFKGLLDEVALYDKALTQPEVNGIYNRSLGQVAPSFIFQPQDVEMVLGDLDFDAVFEVQAGGTQPLSYQWKKDGVDIPGENESTLTIEGAGPPDEGSYSVSIANVAGSLLSDSATLTVICGPVTPGGATTIEGDTVTFTVTMPEDSTGYLYQWSGPGGVIPGATDAAITLTGVTPAESGDYTVEVTLGPDMVTSDPVTLAVLATVGDGYGNVVSGDSPVIFWRLNETNNAYTAVNTMDPGGFNDAEYLTIDLVPGGTVAVEQAVSGALLGDPDTAVRFPGTQDAKVELFDPYDVGTASITVELWAQATGGGGFRSPITCRDIFEGDISGWTMYATGDNTWQWRVGAGAAAGGAWTTLEGGEVVNGKWTHLVGTYDAGTQTMEFYVDGVLAGSQTGVAYAPQWNTPLWLGAGSTETVNGGFYWVGGIDEVAIYDSALSVSEVQNHYAASFGVGTAPVIGLDPQDALVVEGNAASMVVGARGLPLVTFQWQKDGVDVPGANLATLDVDAVVPADAGAYRCIVANGNGAVTSEVGQLDVLAFGGVGISFNLKETWLDQEIPPTDIAGFFPLAFWNNVVHTNQQPQAGLVDANGNPVGLDMRWSMSNVWGDGTAGFATPDAVLARGYWDDGDNPGGANGNGGAAGDGIGVSVTVDNVPYATYTVVLYRSSDQGTGGAYTTYTVNGVGKTSGTTTPYGTLGGWVLGENALIYEGVTGSTLNIDVNARDGVNRGSLCGFQIISPEAYVPPVWITGFAIDGAGMYSLSWESVSGSVYAVEAESDLVDGPWAVEPGADAIPATGDTTSWSGTAGAPSSNYRVVEP